MKITFNVDIDAEKLIRYNGPKRLDKESAQVIINDLAKSAPTSLCKAIQGKARIVLFEGPAACTCYAKVVQALEDIAASNVYTYHSVERVFRKEDGEVDYVDVIHIDSARKGDGEDSETCCDLLDSIMDILDDFHPSSVFYDIDPRGSLDTLFSKDKVEVKWCKHLDIIVITGLDRSSQAALNRRMNSKC